MHESVRSQWIFFNDPLEGRVRHMYLDVKGWVSTGIGNKIDETAQPLSASTAAERAASLGLAGELAWLNRAGERASADEVAAEWDAVKARLDLASAGHTAFEPIVRLRLDDAEIDRFVIAKVDQFERALRGRPEFTGFDGWPADAQLAVLSMSWGLGPAFRFPKFQQHVAAGDWLSAAEECRMQPNTGTIKIRNILNRSLLQSAARVISEGRDPTLLTLDLTTTLGVQRALRRLGKGPGFEDGADGPKTQGAVSAFQAENDLPVTGQADVSTVAAMASQLDTTTYSPITG